MNHFMLNLVRSYCSIANNQLMTATKAKLVKKMLDTNSYAYQLFKSMVDKPEIKFLNDLFINAGFELRIAGGAVRDILCGIKPNDLDFASNARPDDMIKLLFDKECIRLITTPSGERHGTIMARINDTTYEITTLRIDKITDGRHAIVEFVNDWKLDASRRDLTINSMFLGLDGVLYDYFNGENDLKQNNVLFVGDPESRIKEDYLRIFRYFRFHARYGCGGKHDQKTLEIIKNNCDGLTRLSGERIWAELKRILTIRQCNDVISVMFNHLDIGKYIGYKCESGSNNDQCNVDLSEFDRVIARLNGAIDSGFIQSWDPCTLFASIFQNSDQLISVSQRIKLSNVERESILYIIINRNDFVNVTLDDLCIQLALTPKPRQSSAKKYMIECLKYCGYFSYIDKFSNWEIPEFPLRGQLIGERVKTRNLISKVLDELRYTWAKSNFKLTENDLVLELEKLLTDDRFKNK